MSEKQHLLLFIIANYSFMRGIYQLVKVFDRASFPSQVDISLQPLLKERLIEVDGWFKNNTPATYRVTNKGLDYLRGTVKIESLIDYVRTLDEPSQLLMLLKD